MVYLFYFLILNPLTSKSCDYFNPITELGEKKKHKNEKYVLHINMQMKSFRRKLTDKKGKSV